MIYIGTCIIYLVVVSTLQTITPVGGIVQQNKDCTDTEWCNIDIPPKSLFGFASKIDKVRWREAQIKAASGEQVLLSRILQHFPNYLNFLDGDVEFRKYHHLADFFVDRNRDLSPLISNAPIPSKSRARQGEPYKWSKNKVLPRDHDFYNSSRAPIFKVGYFAFSRPKSALFGGPVVGKAVVSRDMLFEHWNRVKDMLTTPFIALDVHDENWGLFSTQFPNRTSNWGLCCTEKEHAAIMEFLDHNMTLMVVVNQHSNITHPKLVTLPRGLPLHSEHGGRLIWDTMHSILDNHTSKDKFVFTSSSNSVYRPQILSCIKKKFTDKEFTVQIVNTEENINKKVQMGDQAYRREYYRNLATTRVGIALPGIGYDTYRYVLHSYKKALF